MARVKSITQTANLFALTTDIWMSRANHAYNGVTIHFLSKSLELHHYLLQTREFPTNSGANIANEVECILKEWDIKMNTVTAIQQIMEPTSPQQFECWT